MAMGAAEYLGETIMTKVSWTLLGMGSIGDNDGPIYTYDAHVNGRRVTKKVPEKAKPTYYCRGEAFRRLSEAVGKAMGD